MKVSCNLWIKYWILINLTRLGLLTLTPLPTPTRQHMVSPLDAELEDASDSVGYEPRFGLTAGGVTPKPEHNILGCCLGNKLENTLQRVRRFVFPVRCWNVWN